MRLASLLPRLQWRLRLGSCVVVCQFDPDISCVLSLEIQLSPLITLSTTRYDHVLQVNPGLADEVRLLVVIKHGAFQLVVVGRLVYSKSQLLVPVAWLATL